MSVPNRRSETRMGIGLPVRVRGFDLAGAPWEEMTKSDDASSGGASFPLKAPVAGGQVLHLSIPLPKRFRRHDPNTTSYSVYAQVRTVRPGSSVPRIGVAFLGKNPPPGFGPAAGRAQTERRRGRRGDVYMKVRLDLLGPDGKIRQQERTVLENFSRGGARLMTAMSLLAGDRVQVEELDTGAFRARAEVRSSYVAKDGIRRLNLRFLPPDQG